MVPEDRHLPEADTRGHWGHLGIATKNTKRLTAPQLSAIPNWVPTLLCQHEAFLSQMVSLNHP